jgi:hypothetical protein
MPNVTKKVLEQENKELKDQVIASAAEVHALKSAEGGTRLPKMVPVRNFGGTQVFIPYEWYGTNRTLVLDTTGARQTGALPFEVWVELERDNNLVKLGYVARTDVPITNVNVIADINDFMSSSTEDEIKDRVSQIENPNVLYRLLGELLPKPKPERTSKEFMIINVVSERIFELTSVRIFDGDPHTGE